MKTLFTSAHSDLLIKLIQINTISPMETGLISEIAKAQELYAAFALETLGCEIAYYAAPQPEQLDQQGMPLNVTERAAEMGDMFWSSQPNLVLRIGPPRSPEQTLMFNFHMDTVDGDLPVIWDGQKFMGRGAVDMKGPGVALLAGIQAAIEAEPDLFNNYTLLIQCVSGEEGGAMGVYGSKLLAEEGWIGDLNLFAEPSDGVFFDQSTSAMTARIDVMGQDATDDAPHMGHNATLLLSYLAERMFAKVAPAIEEAGGKMCLSGIHTGHMHNKVYGSGRLLMNFAYPSNECGYLIKELVDSVIPELIAQFTEQYRNVAFARSTAASASEICTLTWVKQGLPVLNNRHSGYESLLSSLGWVRNPESHLHQAFTCDAMWAQRSGNYTVVFGPGGLGTHGAHAEDEYISLAELEEYAVRIRDLLLAISKHKTYKSGWDVVQEYV
ncbi:acetylornithine deacetylase [Paenibacillus shirakamiensis]|uniref:Acetylornithine deacetylase n=1 Tax=Paenibacillus shirakamiensis TaxID=1265935 RepID=A0ABS4JEZ0_9BACL|nr:M20/M25/M40 family metallo-hydrolase [Paenibacillus shirakamiensis]MBP2000263.1 acetylornithine deacetylase [Paenibacillus shirakamiensis]